MIAVEQDMALQLDVWLALHGAPPTSLVVLAEVLPRAWPLLDARHTFMGVQTTGRHPGDMRRAPGCRPALRPRLSVATQAPDVQAVWQRAALRVLDVSAADRLAFLWTEGQDSGGADTLLWGRTEEAGWAACAGLISDAGLREMPMPPGWRAWASPRLSQRAVASGWGRAGALAGWCDALGRHGLALRRLSSGPSAWRLRQDPVQALLAASETAQMRTMVWGRALADLRGNFSLLRPWSGPLTLRLQWGPLPVHLAQVPLTLAGGEELTARVRSTAHGPLLEAFMPALAPGQGAALHGVLPAYALAREEGAEIQALAWEFVA